MDAGRPTPGDKCLMIANNTGKWFRDGKKNSKLK